MNSLFQYFFTKKLSLDLPKQSLVPPAIIEEFENYYIETSNVQKVKIEPRNIPYFISNKKHTIVKKKHVLVFLKVT
jgi:hypothetical protein